MKTTLQSRLKESRERRGLKQREVAEAVGITQPSYSDLESGKAAKSGYLTQIAICLGVSPEWLITGKEVSQSFLAPASNISPGPNAVDRVLVVPWSRVKVWCEIGSSSYAEIEKMEKSKWAYCPEQHSDQAFAVKVEGFSMEPLFHEGQTVIIDPEYPPRSGLYVIAENGGDPVFRLLKIEGGTSYLEPLNPHYKEPKVTILDQDWSILGVGIYRGDSLV